MSEYMNILGVNLLEIDDMFWIWKKNIKLRINCSLSYAESGVSDVAFLVRRQRYAVG